jgi:outer membrane protein OmpA-like peptidoglycan-associated protein
MPMRGVLPLMAAALMLLCAGSGLARAQEAEDAGAAIGEGRVLALESKSLDIVPKVLAIEGLALGVEGALADLGAKVTEKEIKIALSGDILFDFDKEDLRPDAFPTLEKVGAVLNEYPDAPVLIEGHTDSKGKESYNRKLSERRAGSVRAWFIDHSKIDPERIQTKGWGESKPAAANEKPDGSDDPEGRQLNRRVEITIKTG